jgi:Tfp pilus assembly protein PilE
MMLIGLMMVVAINGGLYLGAIAYSAYTTEELDRNLTLASRLA